MRQRLLTFIVFGTVLVALGEWGLRNGRFSGLDDFWLEFCVGNAGERIANPAVTVVRIDDGYEPVPGGGDENAPNDGTLSRLDYATILALVSNFNPRSIAFLPTPTFDENLVLNKTDITPLKDAAMKLPKLVVASTVSNDGEEAKETSPLAYPAIKVEGDPSAILTFTRTIRYPEAQILANGIPAFKAIESARDLATEKVLRIPLVARRGDQIVPAIVLAAVANHAGVSLDQVVVKLDDGRARILVGEAHAIPIDADGTLIVPAHAGITSSMKSVARDSTGARREVEHLASLTVDELAYTGEADDEVAKRILASFQSRFDSLKENLVLIGFDRTADRRLSTATGETLSETNLIARAIATIQSGRYIHWWPSWARWGAVLVLLAIATLLFSLPRRKFVPVALIAGIAFFAMKVFIFSSTLSWTPPFVLLSLFVLMVIVGLIVPAGRRKTPGNSKA